MADYSVASEAARKMVRSKSKRVEVRRNRKGTKYIATLTKPMGIQIGESEQGIVIGMLENKGSSLEWNTKRRAQNELVQVIAVDDIILSGTDINGKAVLFDDMDLEQVLNFFMKQTGEIVTLELMHLEGNEIAIKKEDIRQRMVKELNVDTSSSSSSSRPPTIIGSSSMKNESGGGLGKGSPPGSPRSQLDSTISATMATPGSPVSKSTAKILHGAAGGVLTYDCVGWDHPPGAIIDHYDACPFFLGTVFCMCYPCAIWTCVTNKRQKCTVCNKVFD